MTSLNSLKYEIELLNRVFNNNDTTQTKRNLERITKENDLFILFGRLYSDSGNQLLQEQFTKLNSESNGFIQFKTEVNV
jgi:hypothetical protein